MVDKKGLKAVNRNEIILIILALIFVGFVFATTGFSVTPIEGGNYSGTITLNCSTEINQTPGSKPYGYNATFYYSIENATDYSASNNLTGTLWNESADDDTFNVTIDTVALGLIDSTNYTIFCYVNNGTKQNVTQINITIDNTAPRVTNFVNTVDGGVYNGTAKLLILNVTVNDSVGGDTMRRVVAG